MRHLADKGGEERWSFRDAEFDHKFEESRIYPRESRVYYSALQIKQYHLERYTRNTDKHTLALRPYPPLMISK